ncbi:ef-hand calcium-binding domain-containing protein [Botrytis cinerea]
MRFLCLHGMGTNSDHSYTHTVAIRYALSPDHTYDFIEGSVPCTIAPGHPAGLSVLVAPGTQTFQYADESSIASCSKALLDLQDYISEFGPYDGIIAFSSGASVAATFIIRQQILLKRQDCMKFNFKCAIFFSGGIPVDPTALLEREEFVILQPDIHGEIIDLPTAHIWGCNDQLYPTFGPVLTDLCRRDLREIFIHQGGHEIPGPDNKTAVAEIVKIIRRTVERALNIQ